MDREAYEDQAPSLTEEERVKTRRKFLGIMAATSAGALGGCATQVGRRDANGASVGKNAAAWEPYVDLEGGDHVKAHPRDVKYDLDGGIFTSEKEIEARTKLDFERIVKEVTDLLSNDGARTIHLQSEALGQRVHHENLRWETELTVEDKNGSNSSRQIAVIELKLAWQPHAIYEDKVGKMQVTGCMLRYAHRAKKDTPHRPTKLECETAYNERGSGSMKRNHQSKQVGIKVLHSIYASSSSSSSWGYPG